MTISIPSSGIFAAAPDERKEPFVNDPLTIRGRQKLPENHRRTRPAAALIAVVFLSLVVAFLWSSHALADPAVDTVDILDTSLHADAPLTIGDTVEFGAEIEHPSELDIAVTRPDDASRWTELDRRIETIDDGRRATTRAEIDYALFRDGPTSGPPIAVRIGPDDETIDVPNYDIDVASVTGDDDEFGPLRPPRSLAESGLQRWAVVVGAVGFALLTAWTGAVLWRRRDDTDNFSTLPPEQRARTELDQLADAIPNDPGRLVEWYVELSRVVRRYLGDRWDFPGTELTTTEITARLHRIDDPDLRIAPETIDDWLKACDRIKFAGRHPTDDRARRHLAEARDIIDATEPTSVEPDDSSETPT